MISQTLTSPNSNVFRIDGPTWGQVTSIYSQCSTASFPPLVFGKKNKNTVQDQFVDLLDASPKQPVYLQSMLAPSLPSHSLRSSKGISLSVPRVKTNTNTRAFHSCAPSLWKNLPLSVCSAISVATFKKHLKTYLFDLAFPPLTPAHPTAR